MRWGDGLANSTTYSKTDLEIWLESIKRLTDEGLPVIPSLFSHDPDALHLLASHFTTIGCQAVEIGLSCPNDREITRALPDVYVQAVLSAGIDNVAVKLGALAATTPLVEQVLKAGAKVVSVSDSLPGLFMNPMRKSFAPCSFVGLSGPAIRPIVLKAIYDLRPPSLTGNISGIGGIETGADAIEYLSLGSTTVQVCTALICHGVNRVQDIVKELKEWLEQHKLSLDQLVGYAFDQQQGEGNAKCF